MLTQLNLFDQGLGWMFVALAALFLLGLAPSLARRFYPTAPGLWVRLAAPVLFAMLAAACFQGMAFPALVGVVVLGVPMIGVSRWRGRKHKAAR